MLVLGIASFDALAKKPGAPTVTLPGKQRVLSPGVVKQQVLNAVGGYPILRRPDLLKNSARARLSRGLITLASMPNSLAVTSTAAKPFY